MDGPTSNLPTNCPTDRVTPISLGTIKASQVVVLNENSVVVTQRKLMLTAITFDFVEKHVH